jgi:hypothetical protein
MKRKARPSRARRLTSAGPGPSTRRPIVARPEFNERPKGAAVTLGKETETPLDAEDLAMASLEARLRVEESKVDLEPEQVVATLTISLPRHLFLQLLSGAARHNIAPSRLIELALARYLRPARGGRRGR